MSQKNMHHKNLDDTPNFQELLDKYFSRQKEIKDQQQSNVVSQDDLAPPITLGICGGHSSGKVIFSGLLKHKLTSNQNTYEDDIPTINVEIIKQEKYNLIPKVDINSKEEQYDFIDWKKMNDDFDKLVLENDVVIVEGTLILINEELRKKLKIKIFLDTDEDVRLSRIVYKEVIKKHKDVRQVIENYLSFQKTIYEKTVLPSKKHAAIVVPNFGEGFPTDINHNLPSEIGGYRNINSPALVLIANIIKQLIYTHKKQNNKNEQEQEKELEQKQQIQEVQPQESNENVNNTNELK